MRRVSIRRALRRGPGHGGSRREATRDVEARRARGVGRARRTLSRVRRGGGGDLTLLSTLKTTRHFTLKHFTLVQYDAFFYTI